jgi:hypothetical protein
MITSVAEPHRFYTAPAPSKHFGAAPPAPTPSLPNSRPTITSSLLLMNKFFVQILQKHYKINHYEYDTLTLSFPYI